MILNFHTYRKSTSPRKGQPALIGNSPAMTRLRTLILGIAGSSTPVLVSGPAGSGKELVARAIHAVCNPPGSAFLRFDARHMPEHLILNDDESSLFCTSGATLFIKNIDKIPARHRKNLIELYNMVQDQNCRFRKNLRMIFSIHGDGVGTVDDIAPIRHMSGFLDRLAPAHIHVPPLCQRSQDIPLLLNHFSTGPVDGAVTIFDDQALNRLTSYDWPGNIRQLKNFIHLACRSFTGEIMRDNEVRELLSLTCREEERDDNKRGESRSTFQDEGVNLKAMVEDMERSYIIRALAGAEGIITQAARQLHLKRTTLIEKMRKCGLDRAV